MNDDTKSGKPNIFPGFRYTHAPDAIAWLGQAFGFEERFVVPGPEDSIAHAQLQLGTGVIMLGSEPAEPDPTNPWEEARHGVYVYIEDIEAHYERACTAGAEILRELQDTEYGSREYTARDPEGNLWSFGTYQPLAD